MPELPEVEVTRLGLEPTLVGAIVTDVDCRTPRLRYPLPTRLAQRLKGRQLLSIDRRGKYLLFDFGSGHLLLHLGMTGSLRLVTAATPIQRHDHFDLVFGRRIMRLRDPRRFGAVLWLAQDPAEHPLIAVLGQEPLGDEFTPNWLFQQTRDRTASIKQTLMDSHLVVGIGNIYASESLFRAGIDPRRPMSGLSLQRHKRLVPAIRETLLAAIAAGGSSLRDFVHSDGSSGYFQQQYFVYGRTGESCHQCGASVQSLRQGGRASFYCPRCQR